MADKSALVWRVLVVLGLAVLNAVIWGVLVTAVAILLTT